MSVYRVYDQAADIYRAVVAESEGDAVRAYLEAFPPDLTVERLWPLNLTHTDDSLARFPIARWRDAVAANGTTRSYEQWLAGVLTADWEGL